MRRRSISSWKSVIFGAGDLFHGGLEIVPSRLDMGATWLRVSRAGGAQAVLCIHSTSQPPDEDRRSFALMPRSTLPSASSWPSQRKVSIVPYRYGPSYGHGYGRIWCQPFSHLRNTGENSRAVLAWNFLFDFSLFVDSFHTFEEPNHGAAHASFFVFLCLSVYEALRLRSPPFTHPVYVASRYFQIKPTFLSSRQCI